MYQENKQKHASYGTASNPWVSIEEKGNKKEGRQAFPIITL